MGQGGKVGRIFRLYPPSNLSISQMTLLKTKKKGVQNYYEKGETKQKCNLRYIKI
jgi:hypothetical protein